jgi:superoxide dismutase, Fe-Mn family
VSHYENNYGGAVKRLNSLSAQLSDLDFTIAPVCLINGLKREELIAMNSMVLHELYFDSLGTSERPSELTDALTRDFGSVDKWYAQFSAMGKARGDGSGWVLLTYPRRVGVLVNQWAADHTNQLATGVTVIALDMYEHSYHIDFGAKAGAYVDAFMNNINWRSAANKYRAANLAHKINCLVHMSGIEITQRP